MKLAFQLYPPEDAIRHLLSLGVDVNARNNAGLIAKDLAQQNYNKQLPGGSMAGYDGASFASIGRVIKLLQNSMSSSPAPVGGNQQKTSETTRATQEILANEISCDAAGTSPATSVRVILRLRNASDTQIGIFSIESDGQRKLWGGFNPGQEVKLDTFKDHRWLLMRGNFCRAVFSPIGADSVGIVR